MFYVLQEYFSRLIFCLIFLFLHVEYIYYIFIYKTYYYKIFSKKEFYLIIECYIILTQFDTFIKNLHTFSGFPRKYICQIDKSFAHDDNLIAERSEEIAYPLAGIVERGIQPNRSEEMHHFWQILSHARRSCTSLQLGESVLQNTQELNVRFRFDCTMLDLVLQYKELTYIRGLYSQQYIDNKVHRFST